MVSTDSADLISDHAVAWAVLAEYGEMTSEADAELDAWLAADARHRGAYLRARAALYLTEDAVLDPARAKGTAPLSAHDSGDEPESPRNRRFSSGIWRSLAGRAALAGATVALGIAGVALLPTIFSTRTASFAEVTKLKDGSIATLASDAKIDVAFSPAYRRINLINGEALFTVAKDETRPFVVQSGDLYAEATGTVYSVRRVGATGGTVRVEEGSVLVWTRDERDQAVLLHAGGELTLRPGPRRSDRAAAEAEPSVSSPLPPPAQAQISLDNVPIKQAIVRFNRINSTKITIGDAPIGEIEIVGLFKANEPETFARAAAAVSGAVVAQDAHGIVIKYK